MSANLSGESDDEREPTVGASLGSDEPKPHPLERFAVVRGRRVDIPAGWDRVTPGESARRGDRELDMIALTYHDLTVFTDVVEPAGELVIRARRGARRGRTDNGILRNKNVKNLHVRGTS